MRKVQRDTNSGKLKVKARQAKKDFYEKIAKSI